MAQEMNSLMNEFNQVIYVLMKNQIKNNLDFTEQENQVLIEEVDSEKVNIDLLRNDISALKEELKIANEDINHIRHLIVKQTKENEVLKKLIVKQVKK